jgi:hypothetical protein
LGPSPPVGPRAAPAGWTESGRTRPGHSPGLPIDLIVVLFSP